MWKSRVLSIIIANFVPWKKYENNMAEKKVYVHISSWDGFDSAIAEMEKLGWKKDEIFICCSEMLDRYYPHLHVNYISDLESQMQEYMKEMKPTETPPEDLLPFL